MMKVRKNVAIFIKIAACISSVMAIAYFYDDVKWIKDLSRLTHPSAFYVVAGFIAIAPSVILFPMALIPVRQKIKLFKSSKNTDRFIQTIFTIQTVGALSMCFFDLRFNNFDLYLSSYSAHYWTYLLLSAFFIIVYVYEKLEKGKSVLYTVGAILIAVIIASLIYNEYGLGAIQGITLISIVCSYIAYEVAFQNIKTGFFAVIIHLIKLIQGGKSMSETKVSDDLIWEKALDFL